MPQSRQVVRWAFGEDANTVSDVFDCGDQFVVAVVTEVNEKGYIPVAKVSGQIKAELMKEKKAERMIADLQAKLAEGTGQSPRRGREGSHGRELRLVLVRQRRLRTLRHRQGHDARGKQAIATHQRQLGRVRGAANQGNGRHGYLRCRSGNRPTEQPQHVLAVLHHLPGHPRQCGNRGHPLEFLLNPR